MWKLLTKASVAAAVAAMPLALLAGPVAADTTATPGSDLLGLNVLPKPTGNGLLPTQNVTDGLSDGLTIQGKVADDLGIPPELENGFTTSVPGMNDAPVVDAKTLPAPADDVDARTLPATENKPDIAAGIGNKDSAETAKPDKSALQKGPLSWLLKPGLMSALGGLTNGGAGSLLSK